MNKREFLAILASLPVIGLLIPQPAGEPKTVAPRYPALPVYAHAGDVVTCVNGHIICQFIETVRVSTRTSSASLATGVKLSRASGSCRCRSVRNAGRPSLAAAPTTSLTAGALPSNWD